MFKLKTVNGQLCRCFRFFAEDGMSQNLSCSMTIEIYGMEIHQFEDVFYVNIVEVHHNTVIL